MKRLDIFIESNMEKMDTQEPDDGHFVRFQEKLNRRSIVSLTWIIRIAAIFLVAVFISGSFFLFRSQRNADLPADLKETAYFYSLRSENLLFDIQNSKIMNISEKQVIMKDIQDFEKEYKIILNDLNKFPGDERLVNAFINYHRSKVEFLEDILNQINATNLIII